MEIWRNLIHPDIADGFIISNHGLIKANDDIGTIIPIYHASNGYDFILLLVKSATSIFPDLNMRYFPLDELVARTFIPIPNELIDHFITIDHIDGNRRNNDLDNLQWVEDIEVWKPVKNFEDYLVSDHGRVKSLRNNIILKPGVSRKGYLRIDLRNHGIARNVGIHRILMETFDPKDDMSTLAVNHINEIKFDNNIKNLEWISLNDNNRFGKRDAKTRKPVICVETGEIYNSIKQASELTGICSTCIGQSCHYTKDHERAGGYHWEFYNE